MKCAKNLQGRGPQVLLVLGAAGGVGSAAVQIGKVLGAVVIAAARSTSFVFLVAIFSAYIPIVMSFQTVFQFFCCVRSFVSINCGWHIISKEESILFCSSWFLSSRLWSTPSISDSMNLGEESGYVREVMLLSLNTEWYEVHCIRKL